MSGHGGSSNGKVAPAAFPPPVHPQQEFIKHGLDAEDELIEVGVAIVGGGTAGLACANRLLQLLADDPETMERLGEVPVAVVEKAKTCGGHNLSGAVMRPGPLQELFPELTREDWRKEGFAFGEVKKESVYMLTGPKTKLPVPIPAVPNFKNHGNEVVSVSALARFQQRQAEEAGAYVLTETAATQLIVDGGRVVGVRSGDKGRGKDGEPLGNFEPGTDIKAQATVLAEGCWGHLTGAAIREFDLGQEPRAPGVGARRQGGLEGPQAARPRDPHVRAAVAAEGGGQVRTARRHLDVPDEGREDRRGPRLDRVRRRPQLSRRHDLRPRPAADSSRRIRSSRDILEGGERVAWGAKALPGGGYWSMPKLSMPGAVLVGDAGGMVDTAALKGVHHCIKSGMLAAESIYAALKRGSSDFSDYEQMIEKSPVGNRALPGAQHAPGVPEGLPRRQPAGGSVDHVEGQGSPGSAGVAPR